jgi:uridine kinase
MTPKDAIAAARALLNARLKSVMLVVAIDGGGGAGKSTLANGIKEAYSGRAAIVRCDDFYRPLNAQCAPEEAYQRYFDWRRLRDEVLIPLRGGKRARYQRNDWTADRFAEWIEIEPSEIVVVEGVFSMRPELQEWIDVAIFIETPRNERIRRMSARPQDTTSWMHRWMAAEDWYLENLAPQYRADLLIDGF